ncbi:MAG TPA: hypothetical protein VK781_13835 [Solirubrobacteraceae bacterium]|nr:hypothetical protein [Solirubrobacteraceae bacterium]
MGIVLFATFVLSAVAAASALALPEWLIDGAAVTGAEGAETSVEFLLTDLKAAGGTAAGIHCKGILDGGVRPEGKGEVNFLLNTLGEAISKPLVGLALSCTNDANCEKAEVWAMGLQWAMRLELEGTTIIDAINSVTSAGYEATCTVLGIKVSDECSTAGWMRPRLENSVSPAGVLMIFAEENSLTCSLSKEKSGDISGEGLMTTVSGLQLQVG